MLATPLVEHTFGTVQELLDAVILGTALRYRYSGYAESPWAFRGHAQAYSLLPSALRPGVRLIAPLQGRWLRVPPNPTYEQRAKLEMTTLRVFFQECDRNGLRLPIDAAAFQGRMYSMVEDLRQREEAWPPPEILPLMAVAQHHGVPTRLLDWSKDPAVAMYFAALGASQIIFNDISDLYPNIDRRAVLMTNEWKSRFEGQFLEIWAFNLREAGGAEFLSNGTPNVRVVIAPRAGNENLYSQHGLFTIPAERESQPWDERPGTPLPLEEIVSNWKPLYGFSPFLVRFKLPIVRGPDLLEEIVKSGNNAARLFPGFDGVVRALKERDYTKSFFEDPPW